MFYNILYGHGHPDKQTNMAQLTELVILIKNTYTLTGLHTEGIPF